MTESFAELFEQSQSALSKLKPGAIVSGVVVEVRNDVVVINAGLKSEGIIPIEQFRNEAGELEIAVGETVRQWSRARWRGVFPRASSANRWVAAEPPARVSNRVSNND